VLKAIRSCARKLKRNPNRRELRALRISEETLYKHFGGLQGALEQAGLTPSGPGFEQRESTVLLDWAKVARELGKLPSVHEYESAGRFSHAPFESRYRQWTRVPEAFCKFVRQSKMEFEWKDVLGMIEERMGRNSTAKVRSSHQRSRKQDVFQDRPCYGPLLNLPELVHEPLNEQGVIFAFGAVARKLGFGVLRFQTGFPDCEALREMVKGQLQRVRIEFEYESRNFPRHRHRVEGCDMTVLAAHLEGVSSAGDRAEEGDGEPGDRVIGQRELLTYTRQVSGHEFTRAVKRSKMSRL